MALISEVLGAFPFFALPKHLNQHRSKFVWWLVSANLTFIRTEFIHTELLWSVK